MLMKPDEQELKYIKDVIFLLNSASDAYYNDADEIISNYEYDSLYDTLIDFENETGIIFDNSPTKKVGFEVKSNLKKETHEYSALSLDKTKDRYKLLDFMNDKDCILSWKLDGLTIQLTYDDGKLKKAITRGNGEIGENITHNAVFFSGIPKEISYKGHLVVRGEALITYHTFNEINKKLPASEQYKNPRNLASGSVRQLDSKNAKRRHICFKAFELVYMDDETFYFSKSLDYLHSLGFDIVPFVLVNKDNLLDKISYFEKEITKNEFPSDGLVLTFDNISYGKSLGMTGKFPRHSIAFKWKDDTAETTITDILWQASMTGLINPVAVFEPVELEGTIVKKATLFNVSNLKKLGIKNGSVVSVYKANKIIPQVLEVVNNKGVPEIPSVCPVCGKPTKILSTGNNGQIVEKLICENPDCQAKHIQRFVHFAERNQMNIVGLSESTIETFVDLGFIKEFADVYHLNRFKDKIINLDGFGEKSYQKLIDSIEKSRKVKLANLIAALGINGIGIHAGKKISRFVLGDIDTFNKLLESGDFLEIDDIGEIGNNNINSWYSKEKANRITNTSEYFNLLKELNIEKPIVLDSVKSNILGKTFVITGDLKSFKNRNELIADIERKGGKVSGSVSKRTDYLINNDKESNSSKNKKAKDLDVSIISEDDYLKM